MIGENCYECESCEKIEKKVNDISKTIYPIINDVKNLTWKYPKDKEKIEKDLEGIRISQTKENMTLNAIHKRMDVNDKQEEVKRIERREDKKDFKKDRRNNLIALSSILFSILGSMLTFALWLSDITHNTNSRLNTIEKALGVKK